MTISFDYAERYVMLISKIIKTISHKSPEYYNI